MTQEAKTERMHDSIERFSKQRRVEHLILLVLFFFLVLTGFPQKYHDTSWARWAVVILGGLDSMHWLHRMGGLILFAFTVYYLAVTFFGVIRGRMVLSMVPFPADFLNVFQSIYWYAGLRDRPPAPRFDHRQKFEFWGLLLGNIIMVVTGLILYFPLEAARWLPGQFIPAAKMAHSYEALLALLIIVLWHLYNGFLRPAIFPLDRSVIDGKISVERLKEEHLLEYHRLFPEEERPGEENRTSDSGETPENTPA